MYNKKFIKNILPVGQYFFINFTLLMNLLQMTISIFDTSIIRYIDTSLVAIFLASKPINLSHRYIYCTTDTISIQLKTSLLVIILGLIGITITTLKHIFLQ